MSKDNQALWSYIINYDLDGEETHAYVYTPDGEFIGNLKIHAARAIVGGLNEAAYSASQLSAMQEQIKVLQAERSILIETKREQLSALQERAKQAERERDEAMGARNENAKLRGQKDAALAKLEAAEARVVELQDQIDSLEDDLEYYKSSYYAFCL